MSHSLLEVRNLVRHYERPRKRLFGKKPLVEALNGVSFSVDKGESFGIVGESGSGKSTLARAILALEPPTAGSVLFKGENLFELPANQKLVARRHVQMVFQDPFGSLDPKHKVRSVVTEPLALVDGLNGQQREVLAIEALADVGLDADALDKYPHEFSGGQRQRIAIARALITRPDLIVADEPVSALDVSVQAQVLNLMMDLQTRFGLTYVIISHDLSVVRHVTDRLAVMKDGSIVELGDTNQVFTAPSHVYTQQLLDSALEVGIEAPAHDADHLPDRIENGADATTADAYADPESAIIDFDHGEEVKESPAIAAKMIEPANPIIAFESDEKASERPATVAAEMSEPASPIVEFEGDDEADEKPAVAAEKTEPVSPIVEFDNDEEASEKPAVAAEKTEPASPIIEFDSDEEAGERPAAVVEVTEPASPIVEFDNDEKAGERPAVAAEKTEPASPIIEFDSDEEAASPSSTQNVAMAVRATDAAIASAIALTRRQEYDMPTNSGPAETVKADVADGPEQPGPEQPLMIQGHNLIDGEWRDSSDNRLLKVINPSDGVAFGYIARGAEDDVDKAVRAARRAMDGPWGRLPAFERGRIMAALSRMVLENVDHLASLEARDVGKPLRQARADAVALARYFEYYGGAADKVHGETIPYHDGYTVLTLREPHGVTGHIVPWNYPMQIIGRSVGAALAMGNACVLKPGEDASLTALEIGKLALEAGLPPGALNIVTGLGKEAGAALAAHPGIDHLSFTGSVETGKLVQKAAADHVCPVTLELGGKSPQIVFADANLDQALPFLVNAVIQNAGQTCSAGSRVLIQDWIYDEVTHRLAKRFDNLDVGPAERDLDCGPVINKVQKERIKDYLKRARTDGLEILGEGELALNTPNGGHYVKPTLIGDVPTDHPLAQEEVFGPVLSAIRFSSEEDAVRIANDSAYGLVAGIWTQDGGRQMRMARAIKTGQVFINNYGAGGGVELPFGGVKSSGFGREKGFEALYGFSTLKTIAIHH